MLDKATKKVLDIDFNPTNEFHVIIKEVGYDIYLRIIEMATAEQQENIEKCMPVAEIAMNVRKRALELFADTNFINGMCLEDRLGL